MIRMEDFRICVIFEIFGIWRKLCPVHHFLQYNGEASVGEQQDRGGRWIIHSASLSRMF